MSLDLEKYNYENYMKYAPSELVIERTQYGYTSLFPSPIELTTAYKNMEEAFSGDKNTFLNDLTFHDKRKLESFTSEVCYGELIRIRAPHVDIQYFGNDKAAGYDYELDCKYRIEVKSKHRQYYPRPKWDAGVPIYSFDKGIIKCTHFAFFSTYIEDKQLVCVFCGSISLKDFSKLKRTQEKGHHTPNKLTIKAGQYSVLHSELAQAKL